MHTIIHRLDHSRFPSTETAQAFRAPHYECMDLPQALKLDLYVPGVAATGVDITTHGTDLVIVAKKAQLVRTNWQSLHIEGVQRDYQLKLRLGAGYDFESLQASFNHGVLTIIVPKKETARAVQPIRHRQVA
jgi:HSP20 family protein